MGTLFEMVSNFKNIEALLENPEIPQETLNSALEEINCDFNDKIDNICYIIRKTEKETEFLKEESDRILQRKKALESKIKDLKEYIENAMKLKGDKKIKTKLNTFSISNNPPSIEVVDETLIPETYKSYETVCKIDKKSILQNIKNGEGVEGVSVKNTSSLRIR